MKSTAFICLAAAGLVHAYPDILQHLEKRDSKAGASWGALLPLSTPNFDAEAQYVDTTGKHAWKAPGENDQRGPCPGLNSMANHGYLPHNGIATLDQFIDATMKVFGMGVDLATILAIYPAVFSGDLVSYSIGGPDSRVSSTLGLLGEPQGLSGSHNNFEGDSSPTRGDLYLTGNAFDLDMQRFQDLYDLGKEKDVYDMQLLSDQRYKQRLASIHENPYFVNAPFSGIIAQPAAWSFIYRFMANKTEEHPEGILNGEILKTFYGVTGEDGDFQYTRGHERIPDNWYTRNAGDAYSLAYLISDADEMLLQHPDIDSIGGNTGEVDTFTGVRIANLTGGVFNAATLTEGNNLFCLAMQLTIQSTPDLVSGLFTDVNEAVSKIGSALNNATNSLGCPKLNNIKKHQLDDFPGATEEYEGYTPAKKLLGIL